MDEVFSKQEGLDKSREATQEEENSEDILFDLRRRPRCKDGTLNLKYKVNQSFAKDDFVSNFYDPKDPTINIREEVIKMYLLKRMRHQKDNLS